MNLLIKKLVWVSISSLTLMTIGCGGQSPQAMPALNPNHTTANPVDRGLGPIHFSVKNATRTYIKVRGGNIVDPTFGSPGEYGTVTLMTSTPPPSNPYTTNGNGSMGRPISIDGSQLELNVTSQTPINPQTGIAHTDMTGTLTLSQNRISSMLKENHLSDFSGYRVIGIAFDMTYNTYNQMYGGRVYVYLNKKLPVKATSQEPLSGFFINF